MKLVERIFVLHLLAATAALSIAFAVGGSLELAFGVVLAGGFWFFANQRNLHGQEFFLLMAFVLASVSLFYWFQAPHWLPLVSVIAALGAWDLDYFLQRLKIAPVEGTGQRLWVEHLRKLAMTEGAGLVLGIVGLYVRLQLGFWFAVILVLLAVIGLSRLILFLRRESS